MESIILIADTFMRFGFLFRLLQVIGIAVSTVVAIYICIWLINRGVQLFASLIGIEVTDFFAWMRSWMPKRKKKRKARKKRVEETLDKSEEM